MENFNTTQLSDENFNKLRENGFSVREIERFYSTLEYRREYNSRPEVKAKRSLYNTTRYERMKQLRSLLKGGE